MYSRVIILPTIFFTYKFASDIRSIEIYIINVTDRKNIVKGLIYHE